MKRIKRIFGISAVISIALTACQTQEPEDNGNIQDPGTQLTGEIIKVTASAGEPLKGFTDSKDIFWSVGDQLKYAGGLNLTSAPLKAEDISQDGHHAEFSFDAALIADNRTGWFVSTKCHPGNDTEVEYTLGNPQGASLIQESAGGMNSRYLFLHTGTGLVKIEKGVLPVLKMAVAGSVFRVIPYTSTYNDESVISVRLESNDYLVGTVRYDRGAGKYEGVNDVNWQKSQRLTVSLKNPFPLAGVTSAESSKGIYMAIAATPEGSPLNGYKFIIETDKAKYVFDAMDKPLVVSENVVKNYLMNLDKAKRIVEAGGELQYVGDLNFLAGKKLPSSGADSFDAGYWYAQVRTSESAAWETREGQDNEHFYSSVTFTATDLATGAPADWISVSYPGNGGTHWLVSAQPNTGKERQAKVVATFSDVKGYVVTPSCRTKEVIFTQADASAKKIVEYASVSLPAERTYSGNAQSKSDIGYSLIKVDGVENRDWSASGIYARCRFVALSENDYISGNYTTDSASDWLSCEFVNNGNDVTDCRWLVSLKENNTQVQRVGYILCLFPEDASYQFPEPNAVKVIQKEKTEQKPLPPGSYAYDIELVTTGGLGMAPNTVGQGNYGFIRNPQIDGKDVQLDDAVAGLLVNTAFKSVVPTEAEIAKYGMQAKKPSADAVKARVRWYGGKQIDVALSTGEGGCITKIVALTPEGTEFGSFIVWTD